jgi:hypothetical protein
MVIGVVSWHSLVRIGTAKLGPSSLRNPPQPLLILGILMMADYAVGAFCVGGSDQDGGDNE